MFFLSFSRIFSRSLCIFESFTYPSPSYIPVSHTSESFSCPKFSVRVLNISYSLIYPSLLQIRVVFTYPSLSHSKSFTYPGPVCNLCGSFHLSATLIRVAYPSRLSESPFRVAFPSHLSELPIRDADSSLLSESYILVSFPSHLFESPSESPSESLSEAPIRVAFPSRI